MFTSISVNYTIPVKRIEHSRKWYEEVLGFKQTNAEEQLGWVELSSDELGVTIGLAEVLDVRRGGPLLVIQVADIEAAKINLESSKVAVSEISHVENVARVATFSDPDEHPWMLRQNLQS